MKKPPSAIVTWLSLVSSFLAVSAFAFSSNDHDYSLLRGGQHLLTASGTAMLGRDLQEDTSNCTIECCMDTVCSESSPFAGLPQWLSIILIIILISMSALFSGLTLGLMGLDRTGLEIVMESDDAVNKKYAQRIYPLRKNGNLLLCTLLLGNTSVNALLSILMAEFTGGTVGFVASTLLILIFGEITPQAACSRYALLVGYHVVPLVKIIVVLMYPLAKPLSFVLDVVLGEELATTYSGAELMKMLQIHVEENILDPDTANTMGGALRYKDLSVSDVMTPLENVFMLNIDEKLNFETIARIFKTGFSRIPVYEVTKNNVVGLLFVKDLIFIDPEDENRVRDFVEIMGRSFHVCWPDDKLGEVLRELKRGRSHMALVRDVNNKSGEADPFYEIRGIITLEDIIEEIIGDEIVDETDEFLDGTHSVKLDRADKFEFARLRLLHSKIVDEALSLDETKAVTAHLVKNYPNVVGILTENQLFRLIATTAVSVLPTAEQDVNQRLPTDLMYEKGKADDTCTLILSGKVTILVGRDEFRSDVSSWALLAAGALEDPSFAPDFTAYVSSGPCRCLRITRASFSAAVDASALERTSGASEVDDSITEAEGAVGVGESAMSRKTKIMTALRAVESSTKNISTDAPPSPKKPVAKSVTDGQFPSNGK